MHVGNILRVGVIFKMITDNFSWCNVSSNVNTVGTVCQGASTRVYETSPTHTHAYLNP